MKTRVDSPLSTIWTLLTRIVAVAVTLYVLWRVRSVLITVILAVMLAYVLLPVVDYLARRRWLPLGRRWMRLVSCILVFAAFFGVLVVAVWLMITPFENEVVRFASQIDDYYRKAGESFARASEWYNANIPQDMRRFLGSQDYQHVGQRVTGFVGDMLESTREWLGSIVELVLIPVLAFYFVLDSRSLKREFVALLPRRRQKAALRGLYEMGRIMQSYVVGQLMLCLIAGVLTGLVLNFTSIHYVLVLAVLAGVTRAIPIIGPIVSGIPICLLGLLQSPALGLGLLVFVIVMHFAESKFIMPILIGDRVKLHPALVLISLLIGAEFFGLLGMFLAAPVAAIIRELLFRHVIEPRRRRDRRQDEESQTLTLFNPEQA